MPTYQYRCTECGTDLEAVQKFSDPALTECPTCHGALRKVFNAVGVVFKGSGFYRTDSRAKEGGQRRRRLEGLERDQGQGRPRPTARPRRRAGPPPARHRLRQPHRRTEGAKAPAKAASGSSTGASSSS